jgi:hypothetical protein
MNNLNRAILKLINSNLNENDIFLDFMDYKFVEHDLEYDP